MPSMYQGQLLAGQKALPATPSLSDFLRQLQAAGDTSGVTVSGVAIGGGTNTEATSTVLYWVPITLTVTAANVSKINLFLDQLQLGFRPAAVLIISVSVPTALAPAVRARPAFMACRYLSRQQLPRPPPSPSPD